MRDYGGVLSGQCRATSTDLGRVIKGDTRSLDHTSRTPIEAPGIPITKIVWVLDFTYSTVS